MLNNYFLKHIKYLTIPYEDLKIYYNINIQEKIKIIPQGFEINHQIKSKQTKNQIPTFAYTGSFIKDFRDPTLLLEYLVQKKERFKFIIYTRAQHFITPYKVLLKDKLEIRDYIPREELLTELRKVDFVVNIQNGNKVDYPSKLIDYSIAQKPVLNINSFKLDKKKIDAFLSGDYSQSMELPNVEQYDISKVANQFICLCR